MAESDKERAERVGDPKLQSAYRALGAEEPPRALDEAILARAKRSAQPWTRRWAVPLSLAAVVVFSVTVTLRIQHEQPGIEQPAPARENVQVARKTAAPDKPATEPAAPPPQQKPMTRKEAQPFPSPTQDRAVAENRVAEPAPAPPAPAAASAPQTEAPALAKRADAAPAMRAMQRDRVAAEQAAGERPALTPEQELERIAGLRQQAKHDEADKALAEFRQRHPDFKIPAALLERVERR